MPYSPLARPAVPVWRALHRPASSAQSPPIIQVSVLMSSPGEHLPRPLRPGGHQGHVPESPPCGIEHTSKSSIYLCDYLINVSLPSKTDLARFGSPFSPASLAMPQHLIGTQ